MSIKLQWSTEELAQLASLSDADLESWMDELSHEDQAELLDQLNRYEASKANDLVATREALAARLKVSLPTLRKYLRLGMVPDVPPFSVSAAEAWVAEYRANMSGDSETTGLLPARIENLEMRTRRDAITAEIQQIELEQKRGTLLLAESVIDLHRQIAATTLTILDGMQDAIDRELPDRFPTDAAWFEIRRRCVAAARKLSDDVAIQMQRLVSGDSDVE